MLLSTRPHDTGCQWHKEIEAGCNASRIKLPILTPRWRTSQWTRYETYGSEAVIPLHVEGDWDAVMAQLLED